MDRSKHLTKLALFPLCDVYGVLIETLCDTSDSKGTRTDALIFAWRLALPENMDIGEAAEAVLLVAMSTPRKRWSERQLLLVRELMAIAEQKGSVAHLSNVKNGGLPNQHDVHTAARDVTSDRDSIDNALLAHRAIGSPAANTRSKETKKWWKLVGREPLDPMSK